MHRLKTSRCLYSIVPSFPSLVPKKSFSTNASTAAFVPIMQTAFRSALPLKSSSILGSSMPSRENATTSNNEHQKDEFSETDHRSIEEFENQLDGMLRVDHAGEYGAQYIYEGQLMVLGSTSSGPMLEHMRDQELEHLYALENLLPERRVRPTILLPLWRVAGVSLGAGSALLGERAAMACTVAVEEVITDHYNDQLRIIHEYDHIKQEPKLRDLIRKHRDEEEEHRHIGIEHEAELMPLYQAFTALIKVGCHAAIWVAKRW